MVTIKDFGWRLGNVMFQLAAALGYALRNGKMLVLPEKDLKGNPTRETLSCFARKFTYDAVKYKEFTEIPEDGFHFQAMPFYENAAICGYRQSYKYFEGSEVFIKDLFEFRKDIKEYAENGINIIRETWPTKKLVSVHIRLGDYLNIKEWHTCLSETDYYRKAVDLFYETKGSNNDKENTLFVVFSDDIQSAKAIMKKLGVYFFPVPKAGHDATDMLIMSRCDSIIIANSSYSWWAAWLSTSAEQVIAPHHSRWFGPKYADWRTDDLLPPTWKQIEF